MNKKLAMTMKKITIEKFSLVEIIVLFFCLVSNKVFEMIISRVMAGGYEVANLTLLAFFNLGIPNYVYVLAPIVAFMLYGSLVFMFITYLMPKLGTFTIYGIMNFLYFYELGIRYLPMLIALLVTAIVVDIILALSQYKKMSLIALSHALMGTSAFISPYVSVWFPIVVFILHFFGVYLMYKPMRCLFPIKFRNEILTFLKNRSLKKILIKY